MAVKAKNTHKQWSESCLAVLRYEYGPGTLTLSQAAKKLKRSESAVKQKWNKMQAFESKTPKSKTPKRNQIVKVDKQTVKSVVLDVKGIKIHMVFS
jgi:hypothetical protein